MAIRYPLNESNSPDNDGLIMPHKCSVTVFDDSHSSKKHAEIKIPKNMPNIPFGQQLSASVNVKAGNKHQKLNMPSHLFIPEPQTKIEESHVNFRHRNTSVEAQQNSSGANGFLALNELKKYLERSNDDSTTVKTGCSPVEIDAPKPNFSEKPRRHSMFTQQAPQISSGDCSNKTMCPNCGFSFIPDHLVVPFWKSSNIPVKTALQGYKQESLQNRFNPFVFQEQKSTTTDGSIKMTTTDCNSSQSSFVSTLFLVY